MFFKVDLDNNRLIISIVNELLKNNLELIHVLVRNCMNIHPSMVRCKPRK